MRKYILRLTLKNTTMKFKTGDMITKGYGIDKEVLSVGQTSYTLAFDNGWVALSFEYVDKTYRLKRKFKEYYENV